MNRVNPRSDHVLMTFDLSLTSRVTVVCRLSPTTHVRNIDLLHSGCREDEFINTGENYFAILRKSDPTCGKQDKQADSTKVGRK